ncbi:MAG: M56 family metallopeptidase [Acidimicrobiia bacterium]|nr:M56 family metallopeptidase [Acidimicrobiia bacterium]
MSLLVIGVGLALLTIPLFTADAALSPSARVRLACISATGGFWLVGVGVAFMAIPLLLWWHNNSEASSVDLGHLAPGGPWIWGTSAVLAGHGTIWLIRFSYECLTARRRAALPLWATTKVIQHHALDVQVRVAPTPKPVAFAVPGRDSHVVISESVFGLAAAERNAVLAHERAHLYLRHDRHLLALTAYQRILWWVPGVRAAVGAHRRAVEQWADREAARLPNVERYMIHRARQRLESCPRPEPTQSEPMVVRPAERPYRRHGAHLIGVACLALIGAYSVTHSAIDLAGVIVGMH